MDHSPSFSSLIKQHLSSIFPFPSSPIKKTLVRSHHRCLNVCLPSVGQLRDVIQSKQSNKEQYTKLLQEMRRKMQQVMTSFIGVLQQNQKTRRKYLGEQEERGRKMLTQNNPIDQIQRYIANLHKIIIQASHTIDCKSKFKQFLQINSQIVFNAYDDNSLLRSYRQIQLLHQLSYYETIPLIDNAQYFLLYAQAIQSCLTYQNALASKQSILPILKKLQGEDMLRISDHPINRCVRYIIEVGAEYEEKVEGLRKSCKGMWEMLKFGVERCYYISWMLQAQIDKMYQSVKQGNKMKEISLRIREIKQYLCSKPQNVFPKLYNRKLPKFICKLDLLMASIDSTSNQITLNQSLKITVSSPSSTTILLQHIKNLQKTIQSLSPLSASSFALIFEQIQMRMIEAEQIQGARGQLGRLLGQIERQVISSYCLDAEGRRKQGTVGKAKPMVARGSMISNHTILSSRTVKEQRKSGLNVFLPSVDDLLSVPIQAKTVPNNLVEQIKIYLSKVDPQAGLHFHDAVTFTPQKLVEFIQIIQKINPKDKQLQELEKVLNTVASCIRCEIVQEKIPSIIFPVLNQELFSIFSNAIISSQYKISKILSQPHQQLPLNITQFLQKRVYLLSALSPHLPYLSQLVHTLSSLPLSKQHHDITSQHTNDLLLKLLLVQKEIKGYKLELQDGKASKEALKLIGQSIYGSMIKYVQSVFVDQQGKSSLIPLLDVSDHYIEIINKCTNLLSTGHSPNLFQLKAAREDLLKYLQPRYNKINYVIVERMIERVEQALKTTQ